MKACECGFCDDSRSQFQSFPVDVTVAKVYSWHRTLEEEGYKSENVAEPRGHVFWEKRINV